MDEKKIRKYAALMKELELTAIEVTDSEGDLIRLEKMPAPPAPPAPQVIGTAVQPSETQKGAAYVNYNFDEITSPMIGVFYTSPTEEDAPYVSVGSKVKKGDTLCIIEAMKLMNEITAEYDGVIKEVCAADGQVVEYGTVLFKIEKTGI